MFEEYLSLTDFFFTQDARKANLKGIVPFLFFHFLFFSFLFSFPLLFLFLPPSSQSLYLALLSFNSIKQFKGAMVTDFNLILYLLLATSCSKCICGFHYVNTCS